MKIVLFGGSFDPVQNGHVKFVKILSERFDRVIVLPCRTSPFKTDTPLTLAPYRVSMLRTALKFPNVEISPYEVASGGVSYTYKSLEHFKTLYPDASFTLAVGSDMLARLDEWREIGYLKENAGFFVSEREGFALSTELLESLKARGYRIETSGVTIDDASSAGVKVDVAFGKMPEVPTWVYQYIKRNGLYRNYVRYTERYPEFHMKPERIEHTYRAVKTGIRLAKLHNADLEKTIVALILHDVGKYADAVNLRGYEIAGEWDELPPFVRHAPIGAEIARRAFEIEDREILDAIAEHTTGKPGMTQLSKIVYLADYTEPGRNHAGTVEARKLSLTDLDGAMLSALKSTLDHLKERGGEIAPQTREAYDYLLREKGVL